MIMMTWAGISDYKSNYILVVCTIYLITQHLFFFLNAYLFEFANYSCRKTSQFSHIVHPHKNAIQTRYVIQVSYFPCSLDMQNNH